MNERMPVFVGKGSFTVDKLQVDIVNASTPSDEKLRRQQLSKEEQECEISELLYRLIVAAATLSPGKVESFSPTFTEFAFNLLYDTNISNVYACVKLIVHDNFEIDDIVQESFIQAWQKLDTLRDRVKFGEWICKIARSRALESIRKQKREARLHGQLVFQRENTDVWGLMQAQNAEYEWRLTINNLIQLMPEMRRKVFQYYYLQDYSCEETANLLHIPLNTVKTHLRRGRDELKKQINIIESILSSHHLSPCRDLKSLRH